MAHYHCDKIENLPKLVENTTLYVKIYLKYTDLEDKLPIIICRGISGILVAPHVAAALSLPCVIIRKDNERSHGFPLQFVGQKPDQPPGFFEFDIGGLSFVNDDKMFFIMIDDFIASGRTIGEVSKYCKPNVVFLHSDKNVITKCHNTYVYSILFESIEDMLNFNNLYSSTINYFHREQLLKPFECYLQ